MLDTRSHFNNNLFDEFRHIQRELDHLFGATSWPSGIRAVARGTYPPINVGSTPDQVDVYLFASGVDPKSLDISIQQNLLTVAGERKLKIEEGGNYYRRERYDGAFRRVVTLPDDVNADKVNATYQNGILHVAIKRRESAKPRQIVVK